MAQENICYCKSSSVRFIEDMIGQLGDEVRFVVDLKQARRSNVDPFRLMDIIGDKVVHLHVSDGNAGCDCLPIGKGSFNFNRLFSELEKIKYDKAMIVELYRENYSSYDELAVCVNNMKRYTISIRWVFDYRKRLKKLRKCVKIHKYRNMEKETVRIRAKARKTDEMPGMRI